MTSTGIFYRVRGYRTAYQSVDDAVRWANATLAHKDTFTVEAFGDVYIGGVTGRQATSVLPCGCETYPRPALEHPNLGCPVRLAFYGAPTGWGVGHYGEVRFDGRQFYFWDAGLRTWVPIHLPLITKGD